MQVMRIPNKLQLLFRAFECNLLHIESKSSMYQLVLQHRKIVLKYFLKGILAQFFYVGAQVGTWSFLIQYVKDYIQKPEKEAGVYLVYALLAFGIGRFVSTALMRKI